MEEKRERQLIKKLFKSLLPLQAVAVGLPAVNDLINSFIIGSKVGSLATASIGFAGPFVLFVASISSLISAGSQLICGRDLGNGNKEGIKTVYSTAVVLSVICGVLITLLSQAIPGAIAKLLQTSSESMEMTTNYIRGIGLGATFTILIASLIPYLQLNHSGNVCTVVVIIQLAVNLAGTLLSVFMFNGNIFLVGLSTALANFFAALVAFIYLQCKSEMFKFSIKSFSPKAIKTMAYSGSPSAIDPICSLIRDIILNNIFYALGGTVAVSAKAIANSLAVALGTFIDGGYIGSSRVIGCVLVGERDTSSLRDLPKNMVESAWYLYVGAYVLVFLFARPIAQLFVETPIDVELYVLTIRIYNLWFLTSIFKTPPIGIYQAMDRVKEVALFTFFNKLLYAVIIVVILSKHVTAPYATLFAIGAEILLILTMAIMFTVKAKRPPRSIFELCYIPSTLSAPREDRFKAVVTTEEEACKASSDMVAFCKSKGLDTKKAYYCGLCLEEIMVFTIKNHFKKKDNVIDVRVIHENGKMSILIRDNCEEFDPVKWLDVCNPEEAEKSIGIKMVKDFADEMNYMSTLGLNVLTIKV